jgi:hypothetical protein
LLTSKLLLFRKIIAFLVVQFCQVGALGEGKGEDEIVMYDRFGTSCCSGLHSLLRCLWV